MGNKPDSYIHQPAFRVPASYIPVYELWHRMSGASSIKDAYTRALETVAACDLSQFAPIKAAKTPEHSRNHSFLVYEESEPYMLAYNAVYAAYKAVFVVAPQESPLLRWAVKNALWVTLKQKERELRQRYLEQLCNDNGMQPHDINAYGYSIWADTEDLITIALKLKG